MRVLFVYDAMYAVGGIQTMLLRVLPQLAAADLELHFLTRAPMYSGDTDRNLLPTIERHVTVHIAEHRFMLRAMPSLRALDLPHVDVIYCCSLSALMLGVLVQNKLQPGAKLVVGVYHPREYCWPRGRRGVEGTFARKLLHRIPFQNVVFATDGMARQTATCLGRDFSSAPVVPLTIERVPERPQRTPLGVRKIVSVTRTTPYYPLHRHMIDVIEQLVREGHAVEYHAYGAGSELETLREIVRRRQLDHHVFFHGSVAYESLPDVFADAFLYIGLGTSLLEAAVRGIPALVAIDCSDSPTTYGFLHEMAGNDLGGYVPGLARTRIVDRIRWVLETDATTYHEHGRQSRERALQFSLDHVLPQFIAALENAQPFTSRLRFDQRAVARLDWLYRRASGRLGITDSRDNRFQHAIYPDPIRNDS